MMKNIANMFFYVGKTNENKKYIKIYSYKTLIGGYATNPEEKFLSEKYYSQSTTIHQGIAHAIIYRFDPEDFDNLVKRLDKCKSLKDLVKEFGYISKKFW